MSVLIEYLDTDGSGNPVTREVSAAHPLPVTGGGGGAGDASAANQATEIGHLAAIETAVEGTLTVSGTVTANLSATDNAVLDSIDAAVNGTLDAALFVNGAAATDANPVSVQQAALGNNDKPLVAGTVAHDAVDSGNPVKIGGKAATADPTAVAAADRVDALYTTLGKQVVLPYALSGSQVSGATSDITNTTSTSVIAAGGAGLKTYVTHILVQNSHATVGTWVNITDGSGGTVLYTIYAGAVGGGASVTLPVPIATTANTALHAVCVTTGANVRVSASGYKAP